MPVLAELEGVSLDYPGREAALGDLLARLVGRRPAPGSGPVPALASIDVRIREGDRVALLGRNGAGKSTLLKVLSGVYVPSTGRCAMNCRVQALHELSLGFEPDATGRDNARYRALMLGAGPRDIDRIVSESIEFADLGEFVDMPVRCYSAGMLVRLAFSVSTSIPGELLLLDEIVGAGDASFIAKARARTLEFVERSRALVLATHDMGIARLFCNRSIVLEKGAVVFDGALEEGIALHLERCA